MNLRCMTCILLCLCISACAVGPNFKRPSTSAPGAYRPPEPDSGTANGAGLANTYDQQLIFGVDPANDWWITFASLDLDTLVREAVARNQTLAAANANVAQARELVNAEAGSLYPQVDFNAGAGRQKYGKGFLGPVVAIPAFSSVGTGVTMQYQVDYLGGVARSIEQREALAQFQRSQADATYLMLTGNVVDEAIQIAAARAEMDAVSELLAEDHDNLDLVTTAFTNGSVSRVDVLTAQSQLATDDALLPPIRQRLAISRHALAVLTARSPGVWTPPDFSLNRLNLPKRLPVSVPSELAHHRPDILAAEAQLHAASAAVGVATANLYPQITLTATGGWQSPPGQMLFARSNAAWSLISGLTAPLFHGGALRAQRRASIDALQASAARYQEIVLESFGEVADVLDSLTHDAQLLAAQANALATATSNLELARVSYREGNSGILQVIDAQRERLDAQLGFLRAQAQQYIDTVQLLLALGGGHRL